MDGIIYKFTIIAKYKFNGHKPFYVGQHWEINGKQYFLSQDESNYPGSGSVWTYFINRMKQDYPHCWRKLIKRETLYASEMINQKGLDVLESYYIKKEQSHYSYKKGGCNILWGTANGFGSGSPSKDPLVRKKMRENHADFSGENNPFFGKTHTKESKEKISKNNCGINNKWYGIGFFHRKHTEESKIKIREKNIGKRKGYDNPFFGKTHTKEIRERIRNAQTGMIWINNGLEERRVKNNVFISKEWNYGRIKKKNIV